ncbi:hypothetical protein GCM10020008_06710 [Lentilactobacillus kefiri DSM 20587 = JCM 5818]
MTSAIGDVPIILTKVAKTKPIKLSTSATNPFDRPCRKPNIKINMIPMLKTI